ncbi:MAG: hypothetical protein ACE14S_09615 [Candidatus Bathyarchaeia archaeon]
MKKAVWAAFFTAAILSGFAFGGCFSVVRGSTSVSGIIRVDATWTKTNSPYILTGPVAVEKSVTLTIEPGVRVELNGFYIKVNGTLIARGTTDNIDINKGSVVLKTVTDGEWDEHAGSDCTIENTVFNEVTLDITGSPRINNNTFAGSLETYAIFVRAGSPEIANNIIDRTNVAVETSGFNSQRSQITLSAARNRVSPYALDMQQSLRIQLWAVHTLE